MNFNKWKSKDNISWFSCRPGENGFLPIGSPLAKLPDEYNFNKCSKSLPTHEYNLNKTNSKSW